jgi:hypothetical protein
MDSRLDDSKQNPANANLVSIYSEHAVTHMDGVMKNCK